MERGRRRKNSKLEIEVEREIRTKKEGWGGKRILRMV